MGREKWKMDWKVKWRCKCQAVGISYFSANVIASSCITGNATRVLCNAGNRVTQTEETRSNQPQKNETHTASVYFTFTTPAEPEETTAEEEKKRRAKEKRKQTLCVCVCLSQWDLLAGKRMLEQSKQRERELTPPTELLLQLHQQRESKKVRVYLSVNRVRMKLHSMSFDQGKEGLSNPMRLVQVIRNVSTL